MVRGLAVNFSIEQSGKIPHESGIALVDVFASPAAEPSVVRQNGVGLSGNVDEENPQKLESTIPFSQNCRMLSATVAEKNQRRKYPSRKHYVVVSPSSPPK
ncbi:hypothetical protein O181_117451 [Austropuccinia psidii MF-1]|uniref:Uncharacterized protein n=1 Tax=Austropuccinia psidii MF-1 TaxID=1389203 RepID=A0A9Q3KCP4_9BASI|nr:hypothetical protein [Austropuccinia psidii MF-1]